MAKDHSTETEKERQTRERNNASARRYRAAHPEKVRESSIRSYHKDIEKSRAAGRKYYLNNREKSVESKRDRRKKNIRQHRATHRKWSGLPEPTRPEPEICECCGGPPNGTGAFHLDHCHVTGIFRGWCCARCNLGLGCLGDDLAGIKRALEYMVRAYDTKTI